MISEMTNSVNIFQIVGDSKIGLKSVEGSEYLEEKRSSDRLWLVDR